MKLVYWMYTGPAHVGILRVASSFKNIHAIMHAPLGDDYFNVMRSMLERERDFTPVTASIIDRYVLARGSKEKVFKNILRKDKEQRPDLIVLTPTCTSSILQEDLQNFVNRASLSVRSDVILADVNHYRVNEFQAADRTLEQIVRYYLLKAREQGFLKNQSVTTVPSVNIIGIFTLGFHNQHDSRELKRLLEDLGIKINEIIPEGASVKNLINLPQAWFNIVPYREVGLMTASFLQKDFGMPYILTTPMGIIDTADFIRQVQKNVNKLAPFFLKKTFDFESYIDYQTKFVSHAAWFSQSTDWQNLTGKKAVVFGDATHAASMTKIMVREMGIHVSCAGTFCKHDSNWFKEQVQDFCDEIIITEDHAEVANTISRLEPSAIFGTQMERHIGKRLGIPCGVISSPVHIQNFPLGYRPFLGFEGTNQIADLVYNSFTLGMEDHLLDVFGGHENKKVLTKLLYKKTKFYWTVESQIELQKIPGFVRDKIKRNTEKFARQKNVRTITVDIMYAAKKSFTNNLI